MKERIVKRSVVFIDLVKMKTLADGSVIVLSEAGPGQLTVVYMDADRSAGQLKELGRRRK